MQNKFFLFILGILLWIGFGAIIGSLSAHIISYTWVAQSALFGAAIGLIAGLIVGLAALSASSRFRFNAVMVWMLAGSLLGAGLGFNGVILLGGYPNRSQADLSFIALAPVGLAAGAGLGTLAGLLIWKYRHRARQPR
jgi:hypothetical protein